MERRGLSFLVVLVVASVGGVCGGTLYQDCGSTADIQEFKISYCEVPPCIVQRPSNYHVNITFTPKENSGTLDTVIIAHLSRGINFPGPDGCTVLVDDKCPIQGGRQYKYSAPMPVLEEYPAISVTVEWKLVDDGDRVLFCGLLPVILV